MTDNQVIIIQDALNDLETVRDNYSDSDNSLYNAMETLESLLEEEE